VLLAFRSFFGLLFKGDLPENVITELGLSRRASKQSAAAAAPVSRSASDGALQLLSILQRDSRLLDFMMEDISAYGDEQVGAAVRSLHDQCRDTLTRYVKLSPVIDGVEGTFTKLASADPSTIKLLGNVPPQPPPGGVLRHKGWRAEKIDLPPLTGKQDFSIIAPAEIEVE